MKRVSYDVSIVFYSEYRYNGSVLSKRFNEDNMNKKTLHDIQQTAYLYFRKYTNLNPDSKGFGLVLDHSEKQHVASIAGTGFYLSSLVIGVENGWISKQDALQEALLTVSTLKDLPHAFGFFAHFLEFETGNRYGKTEYSTIDTALCLCGVLTVDGFFKDAELSKHASDLMNRLEWDSLIFERQGKTLLHMAYNPDKGGSYVEKKPGFIHQWDMFAEQLMMYVMIAGQKHKDAMKLYEGFDRIKGSYEGIEYIYSPGNALFVYQFPLAWLNLKEIKDADGISWFENAKKATLAHRQFAIKHPQFKTFSSSLFGCSASDTPFGYRVWGAYPNSDHRLNTDGTVAPFSMIGSLPMCPDIILDSIDAMKKIEGLWGPCGFYDAFNFEGETPWISKRYYAINKGLELLMVNAHLSQDVYKAFMNHPIIKTGLEVLKWQ
jgi:hypothetical protein